MWDLIFLSKAVVMGIVEGLTEFVPVSSTGHLIVVGDLIGFHSEKAIVFEIVIQLAAILAVILEYKARVVSTIAGLGRDPVANRFAVNVIVAFLPAALLGLLFASKIQEFLFSPVTVAVAFVVGGILMLWVERYVQQPRHVVRVSDIDSMGVLDALKIGLLQCLALIPGMSRSGSTVVGGMWIGLSRLASTRFSFFLAMPTVLGASVYALYQHRDLLSVSDLPLFAVGSIASFISAFACVRWLLRYVANHDLKVFAWYRIAFGGVILLTYYMGWVIWS